MEHKVWHRNKGEIQVRKGWKFLPTCFGLLSILHRSGSNMSRFDFLFKKLTLLNLDALA